MFFADGTELNVVSIGLDSEDSNILNIVLTTNDFNYVRKCFKDTSMTETITQDSDEYNGYTDLVAFDSTEENDLTRITVVLRYKGVSEEVNLLKEELAQANEQLGMLAECILEMGDVLYA